MDLYLDYSTENIYFAPVDDPNYKQSLFDAYGNNFGTTLDNKYRPIAIEQVTDPNDGLYGKLVLVLEDLQLYNQIYTYVFNPDGNIFEIGNHFYLSTFRTF